MATPSELLSALIEERGITLTELGRKVGLKHNPYLTVHRWQRGEFGPRAQRLIEDALGLDRFYFNGGVPVVR